MLDRLLALRDRARTEAPLIHCLVSHIVSNDCANAILAAGGRPFMAEHPREAAMVTASADALLVNLGNISDSKMEAIRLSGQAAAERGIPITMDLVGVAASPLRLDFARTFIAACRPCVIKGNSSELMALWEGAALRRGIDADEADKAAPRPALAKKLAEKYQAVILISGAQDVLSGSGRQYTVNNGHPLLTRITGTGCMQGALAALFTGLNGDCLEAALLAALLLGAAAEEAAPGCGGPGTFKYKLFDSLYNLSGGRLQTLSKIEVADE